MSVTTEVTLDDLALLSTAARLELLNDAGECIRAAINDTKRTNPHASVLLETLRARDWVREAHGTLGQLLNDYATQFERAEFELNAKRRAEAAA